LKVYIIDMQKSVSSWRRRGWGACL